MINFKLNKSHWGNAPADASYLKHFPVALLNWETNRKEDSFAIRKFDMVLLPQTKHARRR